MNACNLGVVQGRDEDLWGLLKASLAPGSVRDCLRGVRWRLIENRALGVLLCLPHAYGRTLLHALYVHLPTPKERALWFKPWCLTTDPDLAAWGFCFLMGTRKWEQDLVSRALVKCSMGILVDAQKAAHAWRVLLFSVGSYPCPL